MLRRIVNLLARDLLYGTRENLLIYSVTAMLLLAVGAQLFLPSLEHSQITFAVDASVPPGVSEQLRAYGRVELHDDRRGLRERVLGFDDVPGIYYADGQYVVMLEGNESEYIRQLPGLIIDRILAEEDMVDLSTFSLGRERSQLREILAMFFVMSMFLVGGMFIGLSIVEDRQSGTIRALAITPLRVSEYVIAKSTLGSLVITVCILTVATIILGPSAINYPQLLLWILSSLGVAISIGFLIGLTCSNVINAIAVIKVNALLITGVTLAFLSIPEQWKWLLYIFPNYWPVEGLDRMLIHTDLPTFPINAAAAGFGYGLLLILVSWFGRRLRLTMGGKQ